MVVGDAISTQFKRNRLRMKGRLKCLHGEGTPVQKDSGPGKERTRPLTKNGRTLKSSAPLNDHEV